jgi:fatty-acyl-CoA synthase
MTKSAPLDVPTSVAAQHGLFSWLTAAAAANPHRHVVRGREGDRIANVTLAELEAKSRRLSKGLQSIGLGPGDTVAAWLPNRVEWIITEFACAALGVAILGLNTRYRSHEISHLLKTVPLSAIVLPSTFLDIDFVGTLESALGQLRERDSTFGSPRLIFLGDIPEQARAVSSENFSFDELLTKGSLAEVPARGTEMSNLFTTSGSTSAPKVAFHDQNSILRHGYAGAVALDVEPGDQILAVLPLCGVFGFSAVMALLIGGGSALMVETFDAQVAARLLEEYGVTHVVGGDEMLGAIFDKVPGDRALPKLRRGGIANFAGRAKEIVAQADKRWGAKISGVYGSSELFALSAIWPANANAALRELGGGLVVDPGIEVRVRDLDTNQPVPDNKSGELQFRGYNVTQGYLNNAQANAAAFTDDGWFKTGDLGYLAHGGFVYQCRAREALRLHGFLVEPGEIEDFLSTEPSIDEVHVVGVEIGAGTKAFAFARARAGETIDETAILTRARHQIATYKVPERLFEVKTFPTTTGTNGTKVRFDELRELALKYLNLTSEANG